MSKISSDDLSSQLIILAMDFTKLSTGLSLGCIELDSCREYVKAGDLVHFKRAYGIIFT